MKITLDTTTEQDAALAYLNKQSNSENQPPLNEFAVSYFLDQLSSVSQSKRKAEVDGVNIKLQQVIFHLTDEDIAAVVAIAGKYEAALKV